MSGVEWLASVRKFPSPLAGRQVGEGESLKGCPFIILLEEKMAHFLHRQTDRQTELKSLKYIISKNSGIVPEKRNCEGFLFSKLLTHINVCFYKL